MHNILQQQLDAKLIANLEALQLKSWFSVYPALLSALYKWTRRGYVVPAAGVGTGFVDWKLEFRLISNSKLFFTNLQQFNTCIKFQRKHVPQKGGHTV